MALLFPGDPRDPSVRSGTPYGVLQGLMSLGAHVEVVDVRTAPRLEHLAALAMSPLHQRSTAGLPPAARLRRGYSAALVASDIARWRSARASRAVSALEARGRLDGVVQLGAGYEVRSSVPRTVYDDMTVAQAARWSYPEWTTMSRRGLDARLAMQRRAYTSATACGMTSSWAAASALEDFGVDRERVHVVGAGSHDVPRTVARSWERPRFLMVGKDFERKNGPRVIEAFARVRAAHPDARLDVVGRHPPLRAPGVVGHGLLRRDDPGETATLVALFDAATCFVMPSLQEPAGVVFTEAAAAGLPSIGGTEGGSADVIGEGGTVVDPTSTDAVARAMLAWCDPALARRTGAIAASRSSLFTWEAVAARLLVPLGLAPGGVRAGLGEDLPLRLPG